jgi:hypothetical protein
MNDLPFEDRTDFENVPNVAGLIRSTRASCGPPTAAWCGTWKRTPI